MQIDPTSALSLVDLLKSKAAGSEDAPVVSDNSASAAAFASMVAEMSGSGIESAAVGLPNGESSQTGDTTTSVASASLSVNSQASDRDLYRLLEAAGQSSVTPAGEDGNSFYDALRSNSSDTDNQGEDSGQFAAYMQRLVNSAYSQ